MLKINLSLMFCGSCGKRGDIVGRRYISSVQKQTIVNRVNLIKTIKKEFVLGDFLCQNCKKKAEKLIEKEPINNNTLDGIDNYEIEADSGIFESIQNNDSEQKNNDVLNATDIDNELKSTTNDNDISVSIPRTTASHRYCFVCGRENSYQKLKLISGEAIISVFCDTNILIPKDSRCCPSHLNE